MMMSDIFTRRFRGFRVVELGGLAFFIVLALGVYMVKAGAGRDRAQIARIERQILVEQTRLRLLRAEVAHLEQPERIERLAAAYLGMAPTSPKHEATVETLGLVALKAPLPAPTAAPVTLPVEDDAIQAVVSSTAAAPAVPAKPAAEAGH
jgi:cell division protein FtsL